MSQLNASSSREQYTVWTFHFMCNLLSVLVAQTFQHILYNYLKFIRNTTFQVRLVNQKVKRIILQVTTNFIDWKGGIRTCWKGKGALNSAASMSCNLLLRTIPCSA